MRVMIELSLSMGLVDWEDKASAKLRVSPLLGGRFCTAGGDRLSISHANAMVDTLIGFLGDPANEHNAKVILAALEKIYNVPGDLHM